MIITRKALKIFVFGCIALALANVANAITVEITAIVPGCGDGLISEGEQCDGANYGGSTCSSLGFNSGTLLCTSACTLNTTNCSTVNNTGGGGGSIPQTNISSSINIPNTNVVFVGKTSQKSKVIILKDSQITSTVFANNKGEFQSTISGISSGSYLFGLYSEDIDGNRTDIVSFKINIASNLTTKIGEIFIQPSISILEAVENGKNKTYISGYTLPNSNINIIFNGKTYHEYKIKSLEDGKYIFDISKSELSKGDYEVTSEIEFAERSFSSSRSLLININDSILQNNKNKKVDINSDGRVDLIDLSMLVFWYKKDKPALGVDLNGDGIVNLVDLSILISHWTS